ncbi:hypothetical protein DF3PB_5020003 [uncultured Defluviicoccus sp.]|uniref:Uncharacterized protein n=1 Tax=metagenome TaxID=256318 RepID=A0A380TH87_9ZZZZ|nr:hypothetical protein DF3PB_3180006 [uncultured Defluviicoccus sp.]SUS07810.1 hypothetical protein DF3PB_5020003 [uncultured Defluviicoccus sp.]
MRGLGPRIHDLLSGAIGVDGRPAPAMTTEGWVNCLLESEPQRCEAIGRCMPEHACRWRPC